MPAGTVNVPFARTNLATLAQILGAYPTAVLTATGTTGFFAGPITLPEWADVTRPIRVFYLHQQADPTIFGQAVVLQIKAAWNVPGSTNASQTDQGSFVPPATGNGDLVRDELRNDGTPDDPLYAAHTFTPGASIGWVFNRLGGDTGDTYPFSVSMAAYLELQIFRRCQKICC